MPSPTRASNCSANVRRIAPPTSAMARLCERIQTQQYFARALFWFQPEPHGSIAHRVIALSGIDTTQADPNTTKA